MANDLRLLVNLLGHEMPVVALVDGQRHGLGRDDRPLDRLVPHIANLAALAGKDHPVPLLQIGDLVGKGRQRDGVRPQIHLSVAVADGQRRTTAGADQQVGMVLEQEGQRESSLQPGQGSRHGVPWRRSAGDLAGHEMRHDLGVGVARQPRAGGHQILPQFQVVLDNAVVHDRDTGRGVRMRVGLRCRAMRRPPGVADTGEPGNRRAFQLLLEIAQLPGRAAAHQLAIVKGRDTGRIVSPILKPLECVDQESGDRRLPQNTNNSAHV